MAAHVRARPLLPLLLRFLVSCSGEANPPATTSAAAASADESLPPLGVPDRGDDPAVVAIDVAGGTLCSGILVAADVVLTAHRCVAATIQQPPCPTGTPRIVSDPAPQSLRILVGDDLANAQERARARALVTPPGDAQCGADVALVLLDTPIDDIKPLSLRPTGAAKGDHLRTVGFSNLTGSSPIQKVVRDHLTVIDTTSAELWINERCQAVAGGPAIDESTGDLVGVASGPRGSTCAGAGSLEGYARADAYLSLVSDALSASGAMAGATTGQMKTKKGPIDMGGSCSRAEDCAAGVCVTGRTQEYCSRTCASADRCPAHFRCKRSASGDWVCVE